MEMNTVGLAVFFRLLLCIPAVIYYSLKAIIQGCIPKRLRYKDVRGETVLITGGGSGLGRELAIKFSKLGCRVILVDINQKWMEDTKKIISGEVFLYKCDVSNRKAVYDMAAKIKEEVGCVTILVNNAGIVTGKKFLECPDEKIVKTFEVNALAHFWMCKVFLPDMIKNNHGHIVSVTSLGGLWAVPRLSDYCSSKFAAVGFEESIRCEMAADKITGVKSTVVCQYLMKTDLFAGVRVRILGGFSAEYVAREVISGVLLEKEMLLIPGWFVFLLLLKWLLPYSALAVVMEACESYTAMNDFTGRKEN